MSGAPYLESALLRQAGFCHAFFTRSGGVSPGPFASLNFSISVGDEAENVAENLERAAASLGIPRSGIFFASQVHGSAVRCVSSDDSPEEVLYEPADGLVTACGRVACAVRTADCVPVLIADCATGAVAAAHAGWRGVVCGIVAATITALRELRGSTGPLIAAIGPHISRTAFEVSGEVAEQLARSSGDPGVVDRALGPRPHVDLRRAVRAQLAAAGLAPEAIDDVLGCTYTEPERFFSFRRDGSRSGRHLSAIVARNHSGS
jgi:YfiH family protein